MPVIKSLPGGMRELITQRDWSQTPLGADPGWPQSLRTSLNILINSRLPMFLFWGEEMRCFYNDAYQPFLGRAGKHPTLLGAPVRAVWPEAWPVIGPYLTKVMETGESYSAEDFVVPVDAEGRKEEWFGRLGFTPVIREDNIPGGVLAVCVEMTDKEAALKLSREREEHLNFILDAAELGTWDFNPATGTFLANKRLRDWFGLPETGDVHLDQAIAAVIPGDREKLRQSIFDSISRSSGGKHDIVYTVVDPVTGSARIVRAKGRAFFTDRSDTAYRFNGTLRDITDAVLAQQTLRIREQNMRELIESSPVAMGFFRGKNYEVASINENMLAMFGKTFAEAIDKPLFEILPADSLPGFQAVLDNVTSSGKGFSAYASPFKLPGAGRPVEAFVDFAYEPIFDSSGSVSAIVVAATDVTEHVLTQRKLHRKKEELKKNMLKASIDAQEKEREYISNELHDNVNQLLACTKLFLELVQSGDDKIRDYVGRGSEFIGQAMDEIRDISHALNPGILGFVGLFKSIREMLEKLNRTHTILFRFDTTRCRKEWRATPDTELTIFRIVQAQVSNIIRHSEAQSAEIVIFSGAGFMELLISDDGKGFDTKKTRKGLGLLSIINRAELLNGSVSLRSTPQNGCRLKIRIPSSRRRGPGRAAENGIF